MHVRGPEKSAQSNLSIVIRPWCQDQDHWITGSLNRTELDLRLLIRQSINQ